MFKIGNKTHDIISIDNESVEDVLKNSSYKNMLIEGGIGDYAVHIWRSMRDDNKYIVWNPQWESKIDDPYKEWYKIRDTCAYELVCFDPRVETIYSMQDASMSEAVRLGSATHLDLNGTFYISPAYYKYKKKFVEFIDGRKSITIHPYDHGNDAALWDPVFYDVFIRCLLKDDWCILVTGDGRCYPDRAEDRDYETWIIISALTKRYRDSMLNLGSCILPDLSEVDSNISPTSISVYNKDELSGWCEFPTICRTMTAAYITDWHYTGNTLTFALFTTITNKRGIYAAVFPDYIQYLNSDWNENRCIYMIEDERKNYGPMQSLTSATELAERIINDS